MCAHCIASSFLDFATPRSQIIKELKIVSNQCVDVGDTYELPHSLFVLQVVTFLYQLFLPLPLEDRHVNSIKNKSI